ARHATTTALLLLSWLICALVYTPRGSKAISLRCAHRTLRPRAVQGLLSGTRRRQACCSGGAPPRTGQVVRAGRRRNRERGLRRLLHELMAGPELDLAPIAHDHQLQELRLELPRGRIFGQP